jgi:hypothetical protein
MPARRKFSTADLERCFNAGLGVVETARQLGVGKAAVSKRAKAMNLTLEKLTRGEKITRDLVLIHSGEIVGKEINAVDQLQKINQHTNSLLDALMSMISGEGEAPEFPKGLRWKDPRELALKAMGEIRQQISAQFEMLRDLYDMNQVAKFQDEVLTAIGEVAADVREKIIENLRRKRIIRAAIKCD